jgi:hypothetical protein
VAVSLLKRTPNRVITSLIKCKVWVRKMEEHDEGKKVEETGKSARTKGGKNE